MCRTVALELIKQPGGSVWVAEAPNWVDGGTPFLIGIMPDAIRNVAKRGFRNALGQLYGVLGPGLIMTRHVFQGLKRDMLVRNDSQADVKKLALTWDAARDGVYVGDAHTGALQYHGARPERVFGVYVSANEMLGDFPSVYGWAEHWTWIAADPTKVGAPIDYTTRYGEHLWTSPR